MTKSNQVFIFDLGAWKGRGGRSVYPGYTEFLYSDVFAGDVIPYNPEYEDPSGYPDAAKYRPVGPRVSRAACTRIDVDTFTPASGQVYSQLDIRCRVFQPPTVSDGSFYMEDCYVTPTFTPAQRPTAERGIVQGHNLDFGGAHFKFCSFGGPASSRSAWINGIEGGNYLAEYCAVSRAVDGLKWNAVGNGRFHGGVITHGSYFGYWNDASGAARTADFTDFGGDFWAINTINEGHSDGATHTDGVQSAKGTGWELKGTRIGQGLRYDNLAALNMDPTVAADYARIMGYDADGTYLNSGVICNSDGTGVVGILIQYCLLSEGAATLSLPWRAEDNGSGVHVRDTLIVPNGHGYQINRQTVTGSNASEITNVLKSTDRTPADIHGF